VVRIAVLVDDAAGGKIAYEQLEKIGVGGVFARRAPAKVITYVATRRPRMVVQMADY
jgi:hypothetical protein